MFKDKNNNNDPEKDANINTDADKKSENTDEEDILQAESKPKTKKTAFYKKRSFKFGSMATAFSAIFIAIIIFLNVGLTVLSSKYPLSLDLTSSKSYQLSSETLKFLNSKVKQPITIKMFATQSQMEGADKQYFGGAIRLIQQYPEHSSKISIQYIDIEKNPTSAAAYPNENIAQGDVVLSTTSSDGKEHYKVLSSSDLTVTETDSSTYQQTVVGNKAEQAIDSAIDYVTSNVHPTIIFTSGHDEKDSSGYQSLLKSANYNVTTTNIAAKDINKSASAIVIADPQSDFTASEIDKIDKFLKNDGKYGKNIFIYLDPQVDLPKIEEYVSEWGVKVEKGVVYDNTNSISSVYNPLASGVDSDITGISSTTNIPTVASLARPLTILFDSKDNRTVKSVITTGESSQLQTDLSAGTASSDKKGPFNVMTLSTWSSSDGAGTTYKSNMVVSGSFEILDQNILNQTNLNNSKVLLGLSNKLMGKQSSISVISKYNATAKLSLTTAQRSVAFVILVVIIPIAILTIGLIQWLRRRHL